MKLIKVIADIVCTTLFDPDVLAKARRRKGAFTRNNGKLSYLTVLKLLLKNVKRTISSVLDEFFMTIDRASGFSMDRVSGCSHQAYSKARSGIDHTIFKECFSRMLDFLCSQEMIENQERIHGLWGIQPIAIDGSRIDLPNRKILKDKYGGCGRDGSSPTALASIAYDVLRGIILDADIDALSVGERILAKRHLENIMIHKRVNLMYAMFVFDRGYASKDLIKYIMNVLHSCYLFRVRQKFNLDIDALPIPQGDEIIDAAVAIDPEITVRVLRFRLSSGIVETLITNAFGVSQSMFKLLYAMRWPVEGNYDLIKNKIGLTNFNGYSENSILQEFWISVLMANFTNLTAKEVDGIIKGSSISGDNKHVYKVNINELVGCISRCLPDYLDADTTYEKHCILHHIVIYGLRNKVVDKRGSNESVPRKEPRKVKHHFNRKTSH